MVSTFVRDRKGASAVEFAMVSPLLLLLVAAILAYGSLFATTLSIQQLAAETARATIGGLSDTERKSLAEAHFTAVADSFPTLKMDHVKFSFDQGSGTKSSTVTVSYDVTDHPAYALEHLLPLPKSPLSYSLIITDGDGATS